MAEIDPEWVYSVDDVQFGDRSVNISGWIHNKETPTPIENARLVFANACGVLDSVGINLPSPDVAEMLGDGASNARFQVSGRVPGMLSLNGIARATLECQTGRGLVRFPITDLHPPARGDSVKPLQSLRIGIGITTYNRREMLAETLQKIRRTRQLNFDLVVCDDGSSDGTRDYLARQLDLHAILGENRGIAWNKNRALFYLWNMRKCDVVLLLEDDVQPSRAGWDIEWVLSTLAHGHVNYAPRWIHSFESGTGRWHKPFVSGLLTGQCSGFTRDALTYAGFLDTRFGRYGHEHVEHTLRMIRAGFGGINITPGTRESRFLIMNCGLDVMDSQSSHSPEFVEKNGAVFDQIWNESIHRWAWRTDEEMQIFRSEMASVIHNGASSPPVPVSPQD